MADGKKNNGIFAAVGAATGLGNALRFPSLCYCYGGAFVAAYVICLAAVCFPLLCAELNLGKFGLSFKKCAPKLGWLACSAAVNSAVIAVYYCVICARLGCAFFSFVSSGEAGQTGGFLLFAAGALSVAAVWFILRGKPSRIARTGAVSALGLLGLFAVLAVAVTLKGGGIARVFSFAPESLRSGGLWADALGQSLLALSLAGGVMPTFARSFGKDFSPAKTAAGIIAANLAVCLLSAVAALSLSVPVPEEGGVAVALSLYPKVIAAAFKSAAVRRVFAAAFFAVLWLVAIQSACSLFSPAIALVKGERRPSAIALFCFIGLTLLPPLYANGCAAMLALDRMACSVNAVIIAFFEAFAFNYPRTMPKVSQGLGKITAFAVAYVCPLACGALALFSLCSARFSCFPLYAAVLAAAAFCSVFAPALLQIFRSAKHFAFIKSHKNL